MLTVTSPFIVLVLLSFGVCEASEKVENVKHVLYFLSMLPYPDPRPKFQPAASWLGPSHIPGARRAIEEINNRTDILEDYHIELIESKSGCYIESISYISFVSNVFHSGKQIVGVIGPVCSDSAVALSSLSGRSDIALVNLHLGSSPLLNDRSRFPYTFTTAYTRFDGVTATIELLKYNRWKSVAALYDVSTLVFVDRFKRIEQEIRQLPDYDIIFSAAIPNPGNPLKQLKDSFARIIVAMVGFHHICQIICIAQYEGMVFPMHQWVTWNRPNCYEEVNFTASGQTYRCSAEDQKAASEGMIVLAFDPPRHKGLNLSNVTVGEYWWSMETYDGDDALNYTAEYVDEVWSLALALNNSITVLEENNLSLSDYQYGQEAVTEIIREQLYQLDFNGESGQVQYERNSGSRKFNILMAQYVDNRGSAFFVGSFESGKWITSDNATFLPDTFPSDNIHVSGIAAAFFTLCAILTAMLVISAHVLTIVYRDYSSVRASCTRLNHFAYVGCYMILITIVTYTVTQAFELSYGAQTALCNITIWTADLGFSLVLDIVLVKTWRLYCIFVYCSSRFIKPSKFLTDWFLAIIVLVLFSFDIAICLVWSSVGPPVQVTSRDFNFNNEEYTIEVRNTCDSENNLENVIIPILMIYKAIQMACSVCLAFMTRRIKSEDFKTKNISFLIYLISLVCGLGLPLFLITSLHDFNLNISFVIFCTVLNILVILCLVLLFSPPLFPILLRKFHLYRGVPISYPYYIQGNSARV